MNDLPDEKTNVVVLELRRWMEKFGPELTGFMKRIDQGGLSDRDVRMQCLALFVKENNASPAHCVAYLEEIDRLAHYVLTGRNPTIAPAQHGVMGLDGEWVKQPAAEG